jgi:eukaryotic-like serine/threonine-protein kinase
MRPRTPAPDGQLERAPVRAGTLWGTVTETEEGRAYYQQRLALAGLCMALLSGGTWALAAIAFLLVGVQPGEDFHPLRGGGLGWLVMALLPAGLWLVTRRGRRPAKLLQAMDVLFTLTMVAVLTVGAASQADPVVGGFVALLTYTAVMLARAIVVPSPARRTLLLGILGAIPVVALAAWRAPGVASVGHIVSTACWTSIGIGLGTVASHTIFGLRREVERARVLGQYTLEAKIGEGGMGEVWRASHALLRRPTAIKLLLPSRAGEAALQRFEREVQTTARLSHPSTVAIYDYGRTRQGTFYYAMELLEGIDLERLVAAHGAQPPARVAQVMMQVCGALAEAHDLGLVHRDVKPANVLLIPRRGEQELAKVVDFGLVKEVRTERAAGVGLTDANTITGTPLYMSPEAIGQPDAVGVASDLYALGAVGWFLLVGRPPFDGQTIIEVCGKHLHAVPERPSRALGRPVPADLEDVVLACLEKRPESRPPGARAVRERLAACGIARQWAEAEAARWWDEHKLQPARAAALPDPLAGRTGAGPRTVALDIDGRGPTAARA